MMRRMCFRKTWILEHTCRACGWRKAGGEWGRVGDGDHNYHFFWGFLLFLLLYGVLSFMGVCGICGPVTSYMWGFLSFFLLCFFLFLLWFRVVRRRIYCRSAVPSFISGFRAALVVLVLWVSGCRVRGGFIAVLMDSLLC